MLGGKVESGLLNRFEYLEQGVWDSRCVFLNGGGSTQALACLVDGVEVEEDKTQQ